ncbi:acyl-CoA dehydrogenase [Alicycliphilus denitrificans]|uniref:Acyl-CoA dehydrogenase domain-containing protein n=2 Tax=Alicycliphilus denitrificans TaxID=179636 RepID=F4GC00_ALIDK|nr:acyl-CoA dehydrogenase family protein [Alicycliphilus denitrificans]AEB83574.1 acyl-CoA dehydrogenase domain-containing protein [Alicycliphilus denitrificans K601]QKD45152.1 acyl-CoA dehydrogenase [Alicycliphilus denitrificans]
MNFETSDELKTVRDSLARVLADHYTPTHRQAMVGDETAYAAQAWKEMAGLGLAGLQVPEAFDGLDFQATDLLPLFHELGQALAPVPFLSTSVLGATALQACSDAEVQRELLPPLAAGALQVTCPHGFVPAASGVRAQAQGSGWRLEGVHKHMPYAASADWLVVSARTGDGAGGDACLFLVARHAPGVRLRPYRLIDGTPAADVHLEGAEATALCTPGSAQAHEAMEAANAAGIAAACAEMVGAMEAALRLTVDYVKTRQQFGRAIGENQALRHRIAEMLVALETARSMSIAAAVAVRDGGFAKAQTRADLHRAKFLVGRNARTVCQSAIQLHGGIGMTEEYTVGHYLRRVHVLDQQFGDGASHLKQLARVE